MTHVSPATESEKTILGAILLDNNVLREIHDKLCPHDFAYGFHQSLFEAMITLYNKHQAVDAPMLLDLLKITDEDQAYVYQLLNECPSTANVAAHTAIIREKSVQRQLFSVAKEMKLRSIKTEGEKLIDDIFNRVTFDEYDRKNHYMAYEDVKSVAERMDKCAPDCAEKTLAFRALHLALMHFGSAIAKAEKYKSVEN